MKTGEQASGNLTLNHPNWQLLSVCVCAWGNPSAVSEGLLSEPPPTAGRRRWRTVNADWSILTNRTSWLINTEFTCTNGIHTHGWKFHKPEVFINRKYIVYVTLTGGTYITCFFYPIIFQTRNIHTVHFCIPVLFFLLLRFERNFKKRRKTRFSEEPNKVNEGLPGSRARQT